MLMGFGMGITMTPMTAAVMNAVGAQRAGLGSAMTNTSREVGGVFGIALLGTLLTTKLKSSLSTLLVPLALPAAQKAAIVTSGGHGQIDFPSARMSRAFVQACGRGRFRRSKTNRLF